MKMIKKHFPWMVFALVLSLSLGALDTVGLDTQVRHASEVSEAQTAWVQRQTRAMDRSELGHLSSIQKILDVSRGPGSISALD